MEPPIRALVALYWEARPASPQSAAQALLPAFLALQEAGLSTFFLKACSRKRAESIAFVPAVANLGELLARGVNHRDIDGEAIPELGLSVSLWSGGVGNESFGLSIHVGSTSPHARNCLLLELPASGPFALHQQQGAVQALFARLVEILHPNQGVVCEPSAIRWEGEALSQGIPSLVRYKNETNPT